MITASDSGIKGGTTAPMGLRKKPARAGDRAAQSSCPSSSLVESGGANLNYQAEIFVDGGRTFANMARMSAAGIPHIAVVHGSSTAGGAYHPGLSDYVVVVKKRSKIFLAGPPLLKAATGEIATDEELGGAEMHAMVSGVAEYLAEDDADALRIAREIMAAMPWNERLPPLPRKAAKEPRYSPDELVRRGARRLPQALRRARGDRAPRRRLRFPRLQAALRRRRPCAARPSIDGEAVGIIGNNGPIDAEGSVKAAQFIQLCDQADTPLVFLQNTTGYMVGRDAERAGIVKHGSKMIQAVANARVPEAHPAHRRQLRRRQLRHVRARLRSGLHLRLAQQPHRRDGAGAGGRRARHRHRGEAQARRQAGRPQEARRHEGRRDGRMEKESTALFATARLWDDGLIDPRDSRRCSRCACRSAARPSCGR